MRQRPRCSSCPTTSLSRYPSDPPRMLPYTTTGKARLPSHTHTHICARAYLTRLCRGVDQSFAGSAEAAVARRSEPAPLSSLRGIPPACRARRSRGVAVCRVSQSLRHHKGSTLSHTHEWTLLDVVLVLIGTYAVVGWRTTGLLPPLHVLARAGRLLDMWQLLRLPPIPHRCLSHAIPLSCHTVVLV
jgi:hypothetical protein